MKLYYFRIVSSIYLLNLFPFGFRVFQMRTFSFIYKYNSFQIKSFFLLFKIK